MNEMPTEQQAISLLSKLVPAEQIGQMLFDAGYPPTYSTSIADRTTCGYGELNQSGCAKPIFD